MESRTCACCSFKALVAAFVALAARFCFLIHSSEPLITPAWPLWFFAIAAVASFTVLVNKVVIEVPISSITLALSAAAIEIPLFGALATVAPVIKVFASLRPGNLSAQVPPSAAKSTFFLALSASKERPAIALESILITA